MTILDEIFAEKRKEVKTGRQNRPLAEVRRLAEMAAPVLDFGAAIKRQPGSTNVSLIAEVKAASPSRGVLVSHFDPLKLANAYRQNGANAISVLTDQPFFKGSLDYLAQIGALKLGLPLLRKDFIFDPYQIYEARAAGADALLLIASYLDIPTLSDLYTLTVELGMDALVEVHNAVELEKALSISPKIIGINNRDLTDFKVNFETCLSLRKAIPGKVITVAESGIHLATDVQKLAEAGVDAMLVGEALVTAGDPGEKIKSLYR